MPAAAAFASTVASSFATTAIATNAVAAATMGKATTDTATPVGATTGRPSSCASGPARAGAGAFAVRPSLASGLASSAGAEAA